MNKGAFNIDGDNEWYVNTQTREKAMPEIGLHYLRIIVSGGEKGSITGTSIMPGGSIEVDKYMDDIVFKVAPQIPDSGTCVTNIREGGL